MMKNLTILKISIGVLIVLNIALMLFILFPKKQNHTHFPPPHSPQIDMNQHAINQLELNKEQEEKFMELVTTHQQAMREANEEQKQLLDNYFLALHQANPNFSEELLNQIMQQQKIKIEVTKQHFEALKQILNEEQLPNYQEFVKNAVQQMLGGAKKPPHQPREF